MRVELAGKSTGYRVRLAPETPEELEQLRELRRLGIEKKIRSVEFAVPLPSGKL